MEQAESISVIAVARRRVFPRGFVDFLFQILLWFGFLFAYKVARSFADSGDSARDVAYRNARWVVDFERGAHSLFELSLQKTLLSSRLLIDLASATYWLSQFVVLGGVLLWVYLWRTESFTRFRNWVMLANFIGLIGYVLVPTAPPRMLGNAGFVDTLLVYSGLNQSSSAVATFANPYAAMPSLHAADALIVGLSMAFICRRLWVKVLWLAWPLWVWFTVMATANHFWLDVAGGVLVALVAAPIVDSRFRFWRRSPEAPEPVAA